MPHHQPKHRWRWLQVIGLTMLILAGALFAQTAFFGQLVVALYALGSVLWRVPSRTTFLLAFLSLITTTILLVVQGNLPVAQSFATYTFVLLVAGVVGLGRELKKEGGRVYSIRNHKL